MANTSGTYDVTITDANGCTATDTINVNVLSPISVVKDSTAVTCNGLSDGTASATVSGGLAPYTYLWLANGQNYTTPNASNLAAGTYSFVITDSIGCSLTDSVNISEPLPLTASVPGPDSIADFNYVGQYNNQYIYFHQFGETWENARQICLANGGDLIVIRDSSDQDYYRSVLPAYISWVGLFQDTNDVNYSEPSGGWKWVDGTYPSSTTPILHNAIAVYNASYGYMDSVNYGFNDYSYTYSMRFFMSTPINTQYNYFQKWLRYNFLSYLR